MDASPQEQLAAQPRLKIIIALSFALLVMVGACTSCMLQPSFGAPGSTTTGEASWYGDPFHGRLTASGEVFNKRDITAAHKTLGFGTRVRVTNLENGRSVVVRINDRFPGTKGRVIDLSEASFEQIAPLARGVTKVRLEVLR